MLINSANLQGLFEGFQFTFNQGFKGAETVYGDIAMTVTSTTAEEKFAWLRELPGFREWLGPRVVNNLALQEYAIQNRDFELTIGVPRNAIEDDKYGVMSPRFAHMGRRAAEMPDSLVFELLRSAFTAKCYDGQSFFDTDHPVIKEDITSSVSNMQDGAGEPWYLFDTTQAIKPLIYQVRKPFDKLTAKDDPASDNVFFNKEYIYGIDGRANAGFGLWQLAFGSKDVLNSTNYRTARAAMMSLRGDEGKLLGIKPTLLLVGPTMEEAALKLINSDYISGGESNPWKGTVRVVVSPWVAAA